MEKNTMVQDHFKEAKPLDTVNRIRNLLYNMGIFTVETWGDSGIQGCCSVRIEIANTHIGQNGKGVTMEFALASGYAEFMERLQSGCLCAGEKVTVLQKLQETMSSEEKEFTIEEYVMQEAVKLAPLWSKLLPESQEGAAREILGACTWLDTRDPEKDFSALPFTSLKNGAVIYVPVPVLQGLYSTNGTCAGNTREEALVQGMSEIVERNHNLRILLAGRACPDIPEEYLEQFSMYSVIRKIREVPQQCLMLKDCSLGTGFPVVAAVLISQETHGCMVKFGAHPVFEIALERALTEMLQGRHITEAAYASSPASTLEEVRACDNRHNVLKNATGKYFRSFFDGKPDRGFQPFPDRSQSTNRELCDYCQEQFQKWGYEVYLRDCSFLGFPTWQILVPGYSEVYGCLRLREKNTNRKARQVLNSLRTASSEELQVLLRYLKFKENFTMENVLSHVRQQVPMPDWRDDRSLFCHLELCLALRLGQWDCAARCAAMLKNLKKQDVHRVAVCAAVEDAVRLLSAGADRKAVLAGSRLFYDAGIVRKLEEILDWERCAEELSSQFSYEL